jgi:hypothetical protein
MKLIKMSPANKHRVGNMPVSAAVLAYHRADVKNELLAALPVMYTAVQYYVHLYCTYISKTPGSVQ